MRFIISMRAGMVDPLKDMSQEDRAMGLIRGLNSPLMCNLNPDTTSRGHQDMAKEVIIPKIMRQAPLKAFRSIQ